MKKELVQVCGDDNEAAYHYIRSAAAQSCGIAEERQTRPAAGGAEKKL